MNNTRVKNAFTLVELILVVVIFFTTVFILVVSQKSFEIKDRKNQFSLINLKEFLIKNVEFSNSVSLVCIENNFDCFISIDGNINSQNKIENVFTTKPEVYEYNQDQLIVDFQSVRVDDIDYDVVFEYKINRDYKAKDIILDTLEDKVYVYNSIYEKARTYESLGDAFEVFEKNKLEVKDAF